MSSADQREALQRLIEERREDYAALSRLIGKNAAYIQQFIKRGSPRRLAEADLLKLARYFGIHPAELGGDQTDEESCDTLVCVPLLNVGASAGPGALNDSETMVGHLAFDGNWLRRLGSGQAAKMRIIKVQGDSMAPTLSDGDDILVDEAESAERPRDGIYVLRSEDSLVVKRLALSPAGRSVTIKSDNPAYPDWPGCNLDDLTILGRVIWAGRRVT